MDIKYDYSRLRGRIREKVGTEYEFARLIGRSANFVSNVFKNLTYFSQSDIAKAVEVLDIDIDDIGSYFFVL